MPAEAGIQLVGDNNNFKYLDSRFRGNDGVFPITTQSLQGEGIFLTFYEIIKIKKRKFLRKLRLIKLDDLAKSPFGPIFVIPAKAGIQLFQAVLDSCFRRSDGFSDFLRDHQT